jgi:hypothetical protein
VELTDFLVVVVTSDNRLSTFGAYFFKLFEGDSTTLAASLIPSSPGRSTIVLMDY